MNFSENWLNVRIYLVFVLQKILGRIIHRSLTTGINGKNDNCRNWPNVIHVCTEFVLTLQGDILEFLSSLHKK